MADEREFLALDELTAGLGVMAAGLFGVARAPGVVRRTPAGGRVVVVIKLRGRFARPEKRIEQAAGRPARRKIVTGEDDAEEGESRAEGNGGTRAGVAVLGGTRGHGTRSR